MLVRSIWAVGAGGQEGAMAPQDFGISYNPISIKGWEAGRGHHITIHHSTPPDFQTFPRPWVYLTALVC